jgi:hypothetical protein
MRNLLISILFALILLPFSLSAAQELISPTDFFGHEIGGEGTIIDYGKSLEYYQHLAEKSNRIIYQQIGKTTDGNPFVLLTISSPENLSRLEEIRLARKKLLDPRKTEKTVFAKQVKNQPAVVFHTGSIHSSEISTAQVPPLVIHKLVTSQEEEVQFILDNTIILYSPSANPDGQFKYNDWYNQHKGTTWEGRMPWLYHTYVGHDNNRDWVFMHFQEQRLTAEHVHNAWNPIYSHEMHEFGSSAARIFVPPYQDPYDYNVAPQVIMNMNALGTAIAHRLTSLAMGGVVQNAHFDLYTPARAYQVYRGTARILTETARGNFARTITIPLKDLDRNIRATGRYNPTQQSWNFPLVWNEGTWSLRDRVDYQVEANFALMHFAASNRILFANAQYQGFSHILNRKDQPAGYILPLKQEDPSMLRELLELMEFGDIEIHRLTADATVESRKYTTGDYYISLKQPYGAWVKTLFELQRYPDYRDGEDDPPIPPYDITGHTLPLLMNVEVDEIEDSAALQTELVTDAITVPLDPIPDSNKGYYLSSAVNHSYILVNRLLSRGVPVGRIVDSSQAELPNGSFYIDADPELLRAAASDLTVSFISAEAKPELNVILDSPFKVGLYEPWGGSMDAGWTRKLLQDYEFDVEVVRNADIQANEFVGKYDSVIIPDRITTQNLLMGSDNFPEQYRGGLGENGIQNLREFVAQGGMLISWGGSAKTVAEVFQMPFIDVATGLKRGEFFAPGSIVQVDLDITHPVNFGMSAKAAAIARYMPILAISDDDIKTPGKFATEDLNLSGFLLGEEHLQGKASIYDKQYEKGRVILFLTLPQFRCMSHGSYKQIFNAVYWASSQSN